MTTLRRPPHCRQTRTGPRRPTRAEIAGLNGSPVSSTRSFGYGSPVLLLEVFANRANDGSLDFRKSRRPTGVVCAIKEQKVSEAITKMAAPDLDTVENTVELM